MNTIKVEWDKIILTIGDANLRQIVKTITGDVKDNGFGVFEMALSTHNLKRIADTLKGASAPKLVGDRINLDKIKTKLIDYKKFRQDMETLNATGKFPVPPNGKFIPYSHQTLIIGGFEKNPYLPIGSDCGTGKTGATARGVEIAIADKKISKGKILVSAPLSILHTSWVDDIKKFTNLNPGLLWTPMSNKKIYEEKVLVADYGSKPGNAVTSKNRKGVRYLNSRTKEIREELSILDDKAQWEKMEMSWKVAIDINGVETIYGKMHGRKVTTENSRELFIRAQLINPEYDLFLINHDGVRIYEEILKDHKFEWVVIDESTKIKSSTSQVWKSHVDISWKCKRRAILSGTPNPNGFKDLWAQYYFLDRGMTIEPKIKDFLYEYFKPIQIGNFYNQKKQSKVAAIDYVIRDENKKKELIDRVRSVGIFLEQRDCIDLPPRTDLKRIVYMTNEQEAAYDEMSKTLIAELVDLQKGQSVRAEAVNVLSKIMKLRQITGGFLVNKEGEEVQISNNPKLEELADFIEELGEKKCVVAAQFTKEIEIINSKFAGMNCMRIDGSVSAEKRADVVRSFQNDLTKRVVVLQPAAAAHGITLTAASHLVFFSLDYNFEFYYQTAKRIERIGQKWPIFIVHLLARFQDGSPTIDEDLLDVLENKSKDRSALFNPSNIGDLAEMLTERIIERAKTRLNQ